VSAGGALRPTRVELRAALASAVLFTIAFPPFVLVGPVFIVLAPIAIAVARDADQGGSSRSGVRLGFWFGAFAYGATLSWIATALSIYSRLAFLGWLAAVLVVAMMTALTVGALHRARSSTHWPMAILLPLVWVAGEVALERLGALAFPWLPLGLATAPTPLLSQVVDISGVHGASFWIASMNGLVADMFLAGRDRQAIVRRAAIALALCALVTAYGVWRLRTTRLTPMATVAIVQPNIPQSDKWQSENQQRIVDMLADGTRRALASHPKLVVWPEAALPDFLFRHKEWLDTLASLTSASRTPILLGILDVKFRPPLRAEYFNGAMLVDADGSVREPVYHKRKLVPVVERVPFIEPQLVRRYSEYFGGYASGHEPVILHAPLGAVGPLVCYESIFPALSREYRRRGAELLVNITNDAWFGRTLGPYQHHAHAVLRAVETRTGIVRAANTGISGYIDPLGREQGRTAIFIPTTETYLVDSTEAISPFVRFGDFVGWGSLAAVVCLLCAGEARRIVVRRGARAA
jgi:apolipoprotein N-acyltransferase